MKVTIKDFSVDMQLGNKSIELEIHDNGDHHLGDLVIGKARLEWCSGHTQVGNGVRRTWTELIDWFES